MSLPQITITPAGFAAIVNAEHDGTAPIRISHVGVTPQAFNVDTVGAAVPGEIKRISTFGGKAVAVDTLHLNIRDDSSDTYTLRGFGLYLSNGVLFAVYSQATPIMEKAAAATLLLATDIRFAKITATSIEVGDVDFVNPPATTTQVGVSRFATDQEATAGSGDSVGMTPKGVATYVNARFGEGAPSDFIKGLMTKATAALLRAALGLKSAALKDEGAGSGLDADLLDGQQGAYYLEYKNITGLPTQWTPAPHSHPISHIEGLQDALDGKVDWSGGVITGQLSVYNQLYVGSSAAGSGLRVAYEPGYVYLDARSKLNVDTRDATMRIRAVQHEWYNHLNQRIAFMQQNGALTLGSSIQATSLDTKGPSGACNIYDRTIGDRYWSTYSTDTTLNWWLNGVGNLMYLSPGGRLTAVSFGSGSALALKNIEGPLPYGLKEVRKIRTLIGRYKADFTPDQSRRMFFDADNFREVMPEAVNAEMVEYDGEMYAGIMWEQVTPPLYKAIGELADMVEALQLEVAELRSFRS